jgi:predicted nucleic acid-binding protein
VQESVLTALILTELIRTGQQIGLLDPFIAATAIANDRPLVTNNTKHYQRIVDLGFPLELENWREP